MNTITITTKDEITMRLVHYFITEHNYTPIVVRGVKDEVWLENTEEDYKIVRINSNYIHNNEQFKMDMIKIKNVVKQIKKKTLSLTMKTFNIYLDVNENVKLGDFRDVTNFFLNGESKKEMKGIDVFFPEFSKKLIDNTDGLELLFNVTQEINAKTEENNRIYENTFKPKKIIVTYVLMTISIFMFFLMYILGKGSTDTYTLYNFGAVYAPAIKAGQYYRLLMGTFLHAGGIHLLTNMYSLFVIGTQLESFVGKKKFLFVYLISAVSGSLMSCIFSSSISVGASGALFGLLGSMLYFGYHYRVYLGSVLTRQIIPIILINLFLGFSLSGIDNAAHIGGLVGGYLSMMAVGIDGKSNKNEKINGGIVLGIYLIFLVLMLFLKA